MSQENIPQYDIFIDDAYDDKNEILSLIKRLLFLLKRSNGIKFRKLKKCLSSLSYRGL